LEDEIVNRLETNHKTHTTVLMFIKCSPATWCHPHFGYLIETKTRNRTVSSVYKYRTVSSVYKYIVRGIHGALYNCGDSINYSSGYLQSNRHCQIKLLVNQEKSGEAAGVVAVKNSSS